jgi:hypothetical protein
MKHVKIQNKVSELEQEIFRKEKLALDAKEKGMHTTYGNYVTDISVLKTKLSKLNTNPKQNV